MSDLILAAKHWIEQFFNERVGHLVPILGDASSRQYFRLSHLGKSYILMHADAQKENSKGFIAIAQTLFANGLNVPAILAVDLELGFILMDDLGEDLYFSKLLAPITDISFPVIDKLYKDAIDAMLLIHASPMPSDYPLPSFDKTLMQREIALFEDWFLKQKCQLVLEAKTQSTFNQIYEKLYMTASLQPQVFVHRDYHAGNLLIGTKPGIIDFQDAVMGPIVYDLASLLLDRYISFSRDQILYYAQYFYQQAKIKKLISHVSFEDFMIWFDCVGLQRNLKIVGIFSRLELRDHKLAYQAFMPRFMGYIVDVCRLYPEFALLGEWMQQTAIPTWQSLSQQSERAVL